MASRHKRKLEQFTESELGELLNAPATKGLENIIRFNLVPTDNPDALKFDAPDLTISYTDSSHNETSSTKSDAIGLNGI